MSVLSELSRGDLERIIEAQAAMIVSLREQVAQLVSEVEQVRKGGPGGKPSVPSWVKVNRPVRAPGERKKRTQSFVRTRQTPTEVRVHACAACPDCGRKLSGGSVVRTREVIDIPETPATITEHRVVARWCGVCRKRCVPRLDLSEEVLGQHRVGVRLMSWIACLSVSGRVPLRRIQSLLKATYGVRLSLGEISEILHALARKGRSEYEALGEAVRESAYVHADETGWRQDGVNGYIWAFVTPTVRYFRYDKSRAHAVPESVLGSSYPGILVSDFYGGYHFHAGLHQRCWVHLLRDLWALKEQNPGNVPVASFVDALAGLYHRAKTFTAKRARAPGDAYRAERARQNAKAAFQKEAMALARPFLKSEVPQRVLAQRIQNFLPELFTFVAYPDVPSENNAAERAVRPCVIARKVCGGTRSPKGSNTKMVLMSLFATWQAQGKDILNACQQMLASTTTHNHTETNH